MKVTGQYCCPLAEQREAQHKLFLQYGDTPIIDPVADHAIMQMYRDGVINVQRIADADKAWNDPPFEEWGDKTAWRLFNATTFALNGRIAEKPGITRKLHNVIDGVCEVVH